MVTWKMKTKGVKRMSKYTTEIRFICETASGLNESKGYNDVADIIEGARGYIFSFDYPIFDENYRSTLETKILKHFYTREIGYETVGLFKLKLDTRMNEIMPYYNKLYESELIQFNPLYSSHLSREHHERNDGSGTRSVAENQTENRNRTTNSSSNSSGTTNTSVNSQNTNMFSDTPQGALTGLESGEYLTNASKDNSTGQQAVSGTTNEQVASTDTQTNTNARTSSENNSANNTKDYTETVMGYDGWNPSKMIQDFRQTLLNIDMQVINDLESLFMQIW